jgi:hypothetical protein
MIHLNPREDKGIVLRKHKSGLLEVSIHPETLQRYLSTFIPNSKGWVSHLAEEKDNIIEGRPSHTLIPTTPRRTIKPDYAPENKSAA